MRWHLYKHAMLVTLGASGSGALCCSPCKPVLNVRIRSSTSAKDEARTSAVRCCHSLEVESGCAAEGLSLGLSGMGTVGVADSCVCRSSVLAAIFSLGRLLSRNRRCNRMV